MDRKKIIFIGPIGAGKSTAINAVSDIPAVATEAKNSDTNIVDKATTTVAMDYGELNLGDSGTIGLYGIPGQRRFNFIWPVVSKGAFGCILLLDASHENCWDDLDYFLKSFEDFSKKGSLIVGLNRAEDIDACIQKTQDIIQENNFVLPVFIGDPRERNDVCMLIEALIANVETQIFLGEFNDE